MTPVPLISKDQKSTFEAERSLLASFWRKEIFQRWYRHAVPPSFRRIRLWHATHQQARFLPLHPAIPMVLTIHDLNYLREKNGAKIQREHRRIRKLIQRAAAVTVISNFVAEEVRNFFDLEGRPLQVIYNGRPDSSKIRGVRPSWRDGSRPFLFSIGIIDRKKNFHVLVELLRRLPNHDLIIAGQNDTDYAREIHRLAHCYGLQDRVCLPGPISDEERQWLYENCESFVFPSLTEGFGLPPIEAMTVGKPVFLARRTSLPEIGGPLAFYWDEFQADHMAEVYRSGMKRFISDSAYPRALKQAAARFCWTRAAREYVDLYCEVLQLPGRPYMRLAGAA